MREGRPILLVDSAEIDVLAVNETLKSRGIGCPTVQYSDTSEALSYLADSANTKPCLILLDTQAPGLPALDFLDRVKRDEALQMIPVIVLAEAGDGSPVEQWFFGGAAGYFHKPAGEEALGSVFDVVIQYWSLSRLPSHVMIFPT